MNSYRTAQLTFVLGRFLGQDVAFERLAPFDGSACANPKALGSALLGLHFWHFVPFILFIYLVRCPTLGRDFKDLLGFLGKSAAVKSVRYYLMFFFLGANTITI